MKLLVLLILSIGLMACAKKEECSDVNALNYSGTKKYSVDDCIYPEIETQLPIFLGGFYSGATNDADTIFFKKVPGAEVDYVVESSITFGKPVVIEPGVTFRIDGNHQINFDYDVEAIGTAEKPITFIREDGYWYGFSIKSVSSNSTVTVKLDNVHLINAFSQLENCAIYFYGSSYPNFDLSFTNGKIISDNLSCGIKSQIQSASFTITGSTFTGVNTPEC